MSLLLARIAAAHRNSGDGDPYWNSVVSLLHMDGVDGGAFIDEISANVWTANGAAVMSTSQKKFGTASLSIPSHSTSNSLKGPTNLGAFAGDFTVELWFYPITNSTTYTGEIIGVDRTSGPRGFQISWNADNTINTSVSGVTGPITSSQAMTLNAWNHVAVCVAGSTAYAFVNGVMSTGPWIPGSGNTTQPITLGTHADGITNLIAFFDELRITKGVARYTSAFTPPVAPFPNHA